MASSRPPQAIFLHVPKTGGTTFRTVLRHAYPRLAVCADPSVAGIERMLAEHEAVEILAADAQEGGTVFANQALMQEPNWDLLRRVAVFVMFRDPIDFVVSLHRHIGRNLGTRRVRGAYAGAAEGPGGSLEAFVSNPLHANLQLAFLVGQLPLRSGRPMEERDLAFGRRLLDELGFHVGVTERYADMLHVFEHVSGSRIPEGRVDHENASPSGHGDLTPELRARIAAANSLDRALYEHACSRVEAQVAAMGPAPAYELRGPDRATAGDPDTSAP